MNQYSMAAYETQEDVSYQRLLSVTLIIISIQSLIDDLRKGECKLPYDLDSSYNLYAIFRNKILADSRNVNRIILACRLS